MPDGRQNGIFVSHSFLQTPNLLTLAGNIFRIFRASTLRDVLLHLLIMGLITLSIVLWFFYIYLPDATHHGENIQVPNLIGLNLSELDKFTEEHNIRYVVNDSSYNASVPAFSVISQHPNEGAFVKTNRKIYLSINSGTPPEVDMPNLINRSVTNAQEELEGFGLKLGEVTYVPSIMKNAVIKQLIDGKEVKIGQKVMKGERVDLVVGKGEDDGDPRPVPSIIGQTAADAEFILSGNNLQLGTIISAKNDDVPQGTIFRQRPEAETIVRPGGVIDVWVAGEETDNQ